MNVDIETVDMMKIVDDLHLRPTEGSPVLVAEHMDEFKSHSAGSGGCALELDRRVNERQNRPVLIRKSE